MENKDSGTSPKAINTEQQDKQPMQEKTETKPSFKTNWKLFGVVTIVAIILVFGGILLLRTMEPVPSSTPSPPTDSIQSLDGIVRFENLEGGCWYLQVPASPSVLEDVEKFELFGISKEELEKYRDQRVEVKGRIRDDMASICQIGAILEVREISSAEDSNQQSAIDTSTWQTYRNDEFGFEFRYPNDWELKGFPDRIDLRPIDERSQGSQSGAFIEVSVFPLGGKAKILNRY